MSSTRVLWVRGRRPAGETLGWRDAQLAIALGAVAVLAPAAWLVRLPASAANVSAVVG